MEMEDPAESRAGGVHDLEPADSLLAWSLVAGETAVDLLRLAKAELLLALKRVPSLFTLCIVLVQFVLLLWLGISALASWGLVSVMGGGLAAALAVFTVFQALACLLVWRVIITIAR